MERRGIFARTIEFDACAAMRNSKSLEGKRFDRGLVMASRGATGVFFARAPSFA
jgi:hypothetical protein